VAKKKLDADLIKITLPASLDSLHQFNSKNFIQSNPLIEAVFLQPFKELELKVLCLISKFINENNFLHVHGEDAIEILKENVGQFLKISISKNQFCDFLQTNPLNFYKQIEILSRELIKKSILIESTSKKSITSNSRKKFITVTLFGGISYEEGKAIFFINPILRLYLQHIKSNFTVLSLEHIANMNSSYAIKIYQLLKQYEKIKKRIFTIEEIKKILGISNLYSDDFRNLRKKVLEPAERNINHLSDIIISFETIKSRKKVCAIQFKITSKKTQFQQAVRIFKKELDNCLNSEYTLLQDAHEKIRSHWKMTKGSIEHNFELFDKWKIARVKNYDAQSTDTIQMCEEKMVTETPRWYDFFLQDYK
jgi:hypothetical protein